MSLTDSTTPARLVTCGKISTGRPYNNVVCEPALSFFYKIIHNLVAIYPTDLLHPQDSRTRHSNPHGFQQIHTSKDTYKFSFYPCTIVQWNMLPAHLVSIDKLDAFKEQVTIPVLQAIYH